MGGSPPSRINEMTNAPNLDNLAMELDKLSPENGLINCSLFTFFWIREACDGYKYQIAEKSNSPVFVYYSSTRDGFCHAQFSINNKMEHFKVKLKKEVYHS